MLGDFEAEQQEEETKYDEVVGGGAGLRGRSATMVEKHTKGLEEENAALAELGEDEPLDGIGDAELVPAEIKQAEDK